MIGKGSFLIDLVRLKQFVQHFLWFVIFWRGEERNRQCVHCSARTWSSGSAVERQQMPSEGSVWKSISVPLHSAIADCNNWCSNRFWTDPANFGNPGTDRIASHLLSPKPPPHQKKEIERGTSSKMRWLNKGLRGPLERQESAFPWDMAALSADSRPWEWTAKLQVTTWNSPSTSRMSALKWLKLNKKGCQIWPLMAQWNRSKHLDLNPINLVVEVTEHPLEQGLAWAHGLGRVIDLLYKPGVLQRVVEISQKCEEECGCHWKVLISVVLIVVPLEIGSPLPWCPNTSEIQMCVINITWGDRELTLSSVAR